MITSVQLCGNGNHLSMHDVMIKNLRERAYKSVWEIADYKKIDKIIGGIDSCKINKSNLFDEVRKLTKNVTSDHSIGRWQSIAEWFNEVDWY